MGAENPGHGVAFLGLETAVRYGSLDQKGGGGEVQPVGFRGPLIVRLVPEQ